MNVVEDVQQAEAIGNLTKQVAKGGGIAAGGHLATKVTEFIFQILLGRILGASAYGIYALGYTIYNVISQILLLGIPNGVVRFGAIYKGEGDERRLKGTLIVAVSAATISSLAGGIALFFLARPLSLQVFNESRLTDFLKILAFSIPFYTFIRIFAAFARAHRRIDYDVGIREIFYPIIKLAGVGLIFLLGFRLLGVAYALLIGTVLSSLFGFRLIKKLFLKLRSSLSPIYEVKNLMAFSLVTFFIGFSHLWLSQTDRIMLGYFRTSANVGIYNAAFVLASQAALFLSALNTIFAPMIADLYNKKRMDQLEALFKTATKWIVVFTLPIFLGFLFFGRSIIELFGPEFTSGWTVLVILASAQLVNAGVGGVGFILIMSGHQLLELGNSIALGGLNILLNIWLIKRYGALGAAIATGFSLVIINLVRLSEVYWLFKIHPYKIEYLKPLGAGLIAAGAGLLFRYGIMQTGWLWLLGLGGMTAIYAVTMIIMGLDPEDRLVWNEIKRHLTVREG